ncbi:MAG: fatty-acid oxidation protein subunit alpha [Alkalinema sp. RU_4_3]|nr:fatty-acid oxidation protein subunit alpha [Alkalinema sp. RU_4_3]
MPARDLYHEAVKRALVKEQWTITHDPLLFSYGEVNFQVDLALERLLAAQRGHEKIAIEIKSFLRSSAITDFYGALGQYLCYRLALKLSEPERRLYLAVPLNSYEKFFQTKFAEAVIAEFSISLIVYNINDEVIHLWQ